MAGDLDLEEDAPDRVFRGELRRLPPGPAVRLVQAITLITLVRSLAAAVFRYALGHRHRCGLRTTASHLILEHEYTLLGTRLWRSKSVVPLTGLTEVTLEKAGEPPHFVAGLAALSLGTFLGFFSLAGGLRAPGGAPWLLGLGALFVLCGVLLDFFVGSGRTPKSASGEPELTLRTKGGHGWVLSGLSLESSACLMSEIENALASPGLESAPISAPDLQAGPLDQRPEQDRARQSAQT